MGRRSITVLRILALVCFGASGAGLMRSQTADAAQEYNVKATDLLYLTRYVSWPRSAFASPTSPFVIAVVAGDAAAQAAIRHALQDKHASDADQRPIELVFVRPGQPLPAHCQIVFVLRSADVPTAELRKLVDDRPLLLVGESAGFAEHGGVINFALVDDNVRLQINLERAEQIGLKLSASLAWNAELVKSKPE